MEKENDFLAKSVIGRTRVTKAMDHLLSRKIWFYEKKFKFLGLYLAEKMRCGYSTWLGSGGRGILEEQ